MDTETAKALPAYLPINQASRETGIPPYYLRKGVKENRYRHILIGKKVYLNTEYLLKVLDEESNGKEGEAI